MKWGIQGAVEGPASEGHETWEMGISSATVTKIKVPFLSFVGG